MKSNVGGIDRVLRIVVGVVLVALAATGTVGAWGYVGVVPLLTGQTEISHRNRVPWDLTEASNSR